MFPEPGIPTRCAVFLPHSNNMHVRLTGNSKLAVSVNVNLHVCPD